jgi:hypothetical protein
MANEYRQELVTVWAASLGEDPKRSLIEVLDCDQESARRRAARSLKQPVESVLVRYVCERTVLSKTLSE